MPLVSIIIPVYNSSKWLTQTIESAIDQTWSDIEIIIVDDGSTDNSLAIAKRFESKSIRVIHQENRGGSAARNSGFAESKGEYIQYLDSDDIIHPRKIEEQIIQLVDKPGCVASGKFGNFIDNIETALFTNDLGCSSYEKPIDWLVNANLGKAMFPPVVWLTPRSIIEKAGPWDESLTYNDDTEFFCRVLLNSAGIRYCPNSISYYRRGIASSVGSQKTEKAINSWLNSHRSVTKHLLKIEDSPSVRISCAKIYRHIIFSNYPKNKKVISECYKDLDLLGEKMFDEFSRGKAKVISKIFGWKFLKHLKTFL